MTYASTVPAPAADLAVGPPIRQSDKRVIEALMWTLKPLVNLRVSIPLPFVTTFLMVALDEGKGVNAYARVAGVHRAMMSRYLRDIGDRARNGGPGLGLVTVEPHPTDSVRTQVFLTTKGRSIAEEISRRTRRASNASADNPPRRSKKRAAI